jgi:hypothetical protein
MGTRNCEELSEPFEDPLTLGFREWFIEGMERDEGLRDSRNGVYASLIKALQYQRLWQSVCTNNLAVQGPTIAFRSHSKGFESSFLILFCFSVFAGPAGYTESGQKLATINGSLET